MKKVVDGDKFVSLDGNYIRIDIEADVEETIKISECKDEDEFVMTGKQLKELQSFWKNEEVER